jgi:hypothetical protein
VTMCYNQEYLSMSTVPFVGVVISLYEKMLILANI